MWFSAAGFPDSNLTKIDGFFKELKIKKNIWEALLPVSPKSEIVGLIEECGTGGDSTRNGNRDLLVSKFT